LEQNPRKLKDGSEKKKNSLMMNDTKLLREGIVRTTKVRIGFENVKQNYYPLIETQKKSLLL